MKGNLIKLTNKVHFKEEEKMSIAKGSRGPWHKDFVPSSLLCRNKAWQKRIAPFGVCRLLISHLVVQTSRPAPRPLLQIRNHTNTLPKVTFTGTCKSGISYSTFPMNLNLKANKCFCLISQLRGVAANISSPQQQTLKVKIKIQEIEWI